jgi:glycosyltransferase involved in cell wall biosynthesis
MSASVLYVGGEDHNLRIPFILTMRQWGFHVAAAGSGDPEPFLRANIPFTPFHFDRFISPVSDLRAVRSLAGILRQLRPDIAQGYDAKPCLFLPLAGAGGPTKTVRTFCGRGWLYSSLSPVALAVRPAYRLLTWAASRHSAATVFEIDDDQKFFEAGRMAGQNGVLIPAGGGGIDVAGFEYALAHAPPPEKVRAELGLGDAEVVITVSRLTRQKGILALLKAAAIVYANRPNVKFLLVGPRASEGPLAISQAEIDRHAPYVIATGPRADVPALLRASDLFAFPTEYREGVPRALLEAAVAGLPIVSTDMPGCCAVVRSGWNGVLVPPRAPDILAREILYLLQERQLSRTMVARARARVRSQFSLDAIAAQHAKLYAHLLSGDPVPQYGLETKPV